MIRNLFFLGAMLTLITMSSCGDDQIPQYQIDREKILKYLDDNNIEGAFEHFSGMFYTIDREGNGEFPRTYSPRIKTKYKGYLLDGTVFDQTTGSDVLEIQLTQLIRGWQVAVPLLSKGGAGTFFFPSSLGYGRSEVGSIPANSVLIFEIELLDFVE